MTTLTDFLLARIAEDERLAHEALALTQFLHDRYGDGARERWHWIISMAGNSNWHPTNHDPARVLAECEAKRRIVEMFTGNLHEKWDDGFEVAKMVDLVLGALALPYASHPDFDEAWRL